MKKINIQSLSKGERLKWVMDNYINHQNQEHVKKIISLYEIKNTPISDIQEQFIENTIANFSLPFAVANNFLINDKNYCIPMVIEESSVVAAASNSAKFWMHRGGFKSKVISKEKIGHIHLFYYGSSDDITSIFEYVKPDIIKVIDIISHNMKKRNGGLTEIKLINKEYLIQNYYQIEMKFDTADSMGANLINTCLEEAAKIIKSKHDKGDLQIIMCILSNYNPNCIVKSEVSCEIKNLKGITLEPFKFADKFKKAIDIAENEIYRAVTHNKGILNGIDALMIATGNDFRAVEAAAHSYACRDKHYKPLTKLTLEDNTFTFNIEIPICLGTVGGLTSLHPMAKIALEILQKPNSDTLMEIAAALGLAQNFAAISSLITTGIQKGHMKLHINNILNKIKASEKEKKILSDMFRNNPISYGQMINKLSEIRNINKENLK